MKNTFHFSLSALLAALFLLSGCPSRDLRPLTPCVVSGVVSEVQQNPADKIDILFMVDNSNSMADEQAALTEQLERMITVLTTGDLVAEPSGQPTVREFAPVTDMHLAVISSDMGAGYSDINAIATCGGAGTPAGYDQSIGDDGLFQSTGASGVAGCAATYPSFLEFGCDAGGGNCAPSPSNLAQDLGCVATLGTGGCGQEQPLEAVLKALSDPTVEEPVGFLNGQGHGGPSGPHAGFLRDDSLLAIIFITDEDDCSTADPNVFIAGQPPGTAIPESAIRRCASDPDISKGALLYPIERYVDGLLKLRAGREQLLVFAAIAGVDQDVVDGATSDGDTDYDEVLASESLTEVATEVCILQSGQMAPAPALRPACGQYKVQEGDTPLVCSGDDVSPDDQFAFPSRRIVEVAKGLNEPTGGNTVVQSICPIEDPDNPGNFVIDFSQALTVILEKIGDAISGSTCLPRELNRNSEGLVNCDVIETLPVGDTCEGKPGRTLREVNEDGEEVCVIEQIKTDVGATGFPEGEGWFYDDFTTQEPDGSGSKRILSCGEEGQRVAFTSIPEANVRIRLECTQPVQNVDEALAGGIGTPCSEVGDTVCSEGLGCEINSRSCQFTCTTNADCASKISSAYTCEMETGFCVNPTCN